MYADDTTLHCCLEDIEDENKELRINLELQHGNIWYGMVWYGMVWYGNGMVWYGMVW